MVIIYLFYLLRLFFVFSRCEAFIIWVRLEVNLIALVFLVSKDLKLSSLDFILKYFLIQSVASVFLLVFLSISLSRLVILFIWLKIIMPPFHVWNLSCLKFMSLFVFYVSITWQKLPLFYLLFQRKELILLSIFSLLVGIGIAFRRYSLLMFFFGSSLIQTVWAILALFKRRFLFAIYFFCYIRLFYFLLELLKSVDFFNIKGRSWVIFIAGFLVLRGFPPFILFFLKICILEFRLRLWFLLFFLLVVIIVRFYFYFRFIWILFVRTDFVLQESGVGLLFGCIVIFMISFLVLLFV